MTNRKGEQSVVYVDAKFDGRDYPVAGSPYAGSAVYHRADDHTLRASAKKSGKVIETESASVSPDSATMTANYTYTDVSGRQATALAVFDRMK